MRMIDLIEKTKRRDELATEELQWIVDGVSQGSLPDYQVAAWLMAVVLRGLTARETAALTEAMAASGDRLDLASMGIDAVDKHSSGGVGDKTTLVLGPMVAAAGLTMAKMSGRGLGFTGGTLDKLEAIPGLRVGLTNDEFTRQARTVGLVVASQSPTMAPADGKLYALRDVTATIDSIPLIAASIMSKKLAAGASTLVLDVKAGGGAFMTTLTEARTLASSMVEIGRRAGLRVAAVISSMDQPLGHAIGNALEVREAIETLAGNGPDDLLQLCLELGTRLLLLHGVATSTETARQRLHATLAGGTALGRLERMIVAQGGPADAARPGNHRLPVAPMVRPVNAEETGHVATIDARALGNLAVTLGAGRAYKGGPIDHAVGLLLAAKVGDPVARGQPLAIIHARDDASATAAVGAVRRAYRLGDATRAPTLILDRL